MYLYKYREFCDNHVNAIADNQLWFAIGDTFNDPFDSKPPLTLLSRESMAEFIRKNNNSHRLLNNDQFNQLLDKELTKAQKLKEEGRLNEHPIWSYIQIVIAATLRRFVFCLSRTNRNVLMWSHYSSSHTGFVVRYNMEVLFRDLDLAHHKDIDYTSAVPDILYNMINEEGQGREQDLLYIKSPDWSYEEEYRLLLNDFAADENDRYRSVEHDVEAVDRIYFGLNASDEDIENMVSRLRGRDIDFFRMTRGSRSIELFARQM